MRRCGELRSSTAPLQAASHSQLAHHPPPTTLYLPHRYASLPGQQSYAVTARVMNYFCNMNSKAMFRYMLNDQDMMKKHLPVSVSAASQHTAKGVARKQSH